MSVVLMKVTINQWRKDRRICTSATSNTVNTRSYNSFEFLTNATLHSISTKSWELSTLQKKRVITADQVRNFKRDVTKFLSKMCFHLLEMSLIKFMLVRNSRCFIPALLIESPESSEARFVRVLENLVSSQHCIIAKENGDDFLQFDPANDRLDVFYWKHINDIKSVEKLAEVLKIILTLSHGQAAVERGFSVNSSVLVENLSTISLISQRIVHDHLASNNLSSEDLRKITKECASCEKQVRGIFGWAKKRESRISKIFAKEIHPRGIEVVRLRKRCLKNP